MGYTWGQLEKLAQDRDAYRALVGCLCFSKTDDEEDEIFGLEVGKKLIVACFHLLHVQLCR